MCFGASMPCKVQYLPFGIDSWKLVGPASIMRDRSGTSSGPINLGAPTGARGPWGPERGWGRTPAPSLWADPTCCSQTRGNSKMTRGPLQEALVTRRCPRGLPRDPSRNSGGRRPFRINWTLRKASYIMLYTYVGIAHRSARRLTTTY